MVNQSVLQERLDALQDYVDKLRSFQHLSLDVLTDPENFTTYWAIQHGLQMAIQCVIDIATHLQASLRLGRPSEYREAILLLGKGNILPPDFAQKMSAVAGFRNILVHEYMAVDPALIHQALQTGLDDFELFINYIHAYLNQQD
jgi:uncharacterized protein YutE (UPF0331/DUF86 family)